MKADINTNADQQTASSHPAVRSDQSSLERVGRPITDAIAYGVVPLNVGPDGFRSVTARIADWHDLGINTLWLSPINTTPQGDYGYAVVDYLKLREDCGSEDDFRALVDTAHTHQMRVLMDFVPNHSSIAHPWYEQSVADPQSPRYDWYDRDEDGQPTHYFNWAHLPNLNYDNPDVQEYMLEAFKYWVTQFDVDGFRVDAAWGIRERRPDFWPRWSAELKQLKPHILLLAEAGARDGYYITHGFDAAYDWTDQLGHWAWENVFETQGVNVAHLHEALTNEGRGFEPGSVIFRFLNNNDTGERFFTLHGAARTRVAAALLLTLPGIPCLFTGDEVGAEYHPYQNRGPIDWSDPHHLRPYYKHLIALRRSMPSLRSLHWERVPVQAPEQVYAFVRYGEPADEPVLVVLNFSEQASEPVLELPPAFASFGEQGALYDALADEDVPVTSTPTRIGIPGTTARILTMTKPRTSNDQS